jgi:hypothetical protein
MITSNKTLAEFQNRTTSFDLYKEYSRLLRDDVFRKPHNSSVSYIRKENDLTIEFGVDKKGKHVKKIYNNNKSFQKIIKTWISDGNTYQSKYSYRQFDRITKKYRKNGLFHRDNNKPAYTCKIYKYKPVFTIEKWYQEGVLHNSEDIAYFYEEDYTFDDYNPHYYSEKLYFWNGQELDKESFFKNKAKVKRSELAQTLYDCNIICKDMCDVISAFVW